MRSRASSGSPLGHGGDDQPVVLDRLLGAAGNLVDRPEGALELVADGVHEVEDEAVLRRLGDREVEGDVGLDVLLAVGEALAHDLGRVAHALEVGLVPPLGGERHGLALEDAAHLEQLAQAAFLDCEEQRERVVQRVAEVRDLERAAAPGADQALGLEHAERLAHRRASDPVVLHQLALGGERVARLQMPLADERQQAVGHELVRVAALDRPAECQDGFGCLIVRQGTPGSFITPRPAPWQAELAKA